MVACFVQTLFTDNALLIRGNEVSVLSFYVRLQFSPWKITLLFFLELQDIVPYMPEQTPLDRV